MSSKEWNLNSGEPELFNYFGRWQKREDTPQEKVGSSESLYAKKIEEISEINIGEILLKEIKKFHTIEDGFSIEKMRDISVDVNGNVLNMQLLLIKTPWHELPSFVAYSPITQEGFQKIAGIINGGITLGKRGTMQNPEPYWSWNTLVVDGLDKVEKMGQPVMVEYNGKRYFDFLTNFFKRETTPIFQ
jgi:hypothetical protein